MTELKLEVGKTYLDRSGNQKVISHNSFSDYPFYSGTTTFTVSGGYYLNGKHPLDLISEYTQPAVTPARTPLCHAEQRHDHADGWTIQFLFRGWEWVDDENPSWSSSNQYRRKPEPAPLKPNDVKFIGIYNDVPGWHLRETTGLLPGNATKAVRIEWNPNDQTLVSAKVVTL